MTSCDYLQLAAPGVRALQPYQPGKPIEELEREYGIKNIIKLASNENPLGTPESVTKAITQQLPFIARYPDGNGFDLKQRLARKYGVDTAMITLGNGSNDVLELIARAFVTTEHSVIYSQYAFAVYPLVTQAIGAKAIVTPARDWGHDLLAMQNAVRNDTRLIFIANPNNPTGTSLNSADLKQFLTHIPESVLVVLDEAYCEYSTPSQTNDSLSWLATHPNLIICRTFSKAYGLAGLRVGYALLHPDVANVLNRVRQPFNVNSLALMAAETVLDDSAFLQQSVTVNQQGMQWLMAQFEQHQISYIPSAGNFITIDLKQAALPIYEALLRQGVIVRPIGAYQMPNHLRISIGLATENARFMEALLSILQH
ncbi:histidinol-phosphate transaminase [Thioflexithrix psekupsensis]|uniref:Histidinol-phosphate aminotransferase n=1 Tax=Thioflexithrix psekupsensis TaxID=1570016 RepID=A0A251X8W1_9GAMM|nr:histidinol-phosphate transaminase [Thioflexithrix psekupsensis]OUD14113.1 histidinol-phosphate transaminase [Thioflexithrix psekupsensis]